MKKMTQKTAVASLVLAALSGANSALANEKIDVIVKLKNAEAPFSVSASKSLSKHNLSAQKLHQAQGQKRQMMVKQYLSANKISPKHVYSSVYTGFAASVSESQLEALKKDPNVEAVYPDQMYKLYAPTLSSNSSSLNSEKAKNKSKAQRTYKKKRKLVDWPQQIPQAPAESGALESSYKGNGQHVYVLDTGVDVMQNDIKDNLGLSYAPQFCNWPGDNKLCPMPFSDDHGHGTHVAGTIGAIDNDINALGMAPEATIHAVKVCTGAGSCPGSSILAGLNWAVFDMLGHGQPAVANLSLGGPADQEAGVCDDLG